MSQPKMTEQNPNPSFATERNFFLDTSLPRNWPSTSTPASFTLESCKSSSERDSTGTSCEPSRGISPRGHKRALSQRGLKSAGAWRESDDWSPGKRGSPPNTVLLRYSNPSGGRGWAPRLGKAITMIQTVPISALRAGALHQARGLFPGDSRVSQRSLSGA